MLSQPREQKTGRGGHNKEKELLNKTFILNKDYTKLLTQQGEKPLNKQGGHNKEIIMLNIETFKKVCLKAGTKKAENFFSL